MMSIHEKREDACVIATVAMARMLQTLKYCYELASGGEFKAKDAIKKPTE